MMCKRNGAFFRNNELSAFSNQLSAIQNLQSKIQNPKSLALNPRFLHNSDMDEPQAFWNGRWIPASAAAVPLDDAGFVLGATVAEQLRTFAGKLFRLEDHLARLHDSLRIVGVELPGPPLGEVAEELVARNHRLLEPGDDMGLSMVVTPGAYRGYASGGPLGPTVCLHTYPLPFNLWADKYDRGQALVTTDVEQVPPACWPPSLKCRSRMHYYLADRQAAAIEPDARALLLDQDGRVTETSTANVLAFYGPSQKSSTVGQISNLPGTRQIGNLPHVGVSPPSTKILHGISLAVAAELAGRMGIAMTQRDLTPDDLAAADEVLLGSTPLCLLPVTRLNGRPIGDGRPGELFHRLLAAWSELVGIDIVEQARRFAGRGQSVAEGLDFGP
jgi:branched-chain amino acid aminotransferase